MIFTNLEKDSSANWVNFSNKMPELEQKSFQKRQVAFKIWIADILNSSFNKDEISAGYIKIDNIIISRVNLIATLVYISAEESNYRSAVIDDGTGKISLRTFENSNIFSKADVGDAVLVIGRIREFNNEKYILPEILKKVNNVGWVNLRKAELREPRVSENNDLNSTSAAVAEEIIPSFNEDIYSLIKKLDTGEGAVIDEIIKNSGNNNAEEVINKMLASGDVFEIKPGKIKVLE